MLFLIIFVAAFRAVMTQDLLGVSYFFDSNFPNTFSEQKCENTTHWELVSYDDLGILPPYETSSLSIRASRNSCTSSFPFVFLNGTLELAVYIRTVSKYSGITITVFDEQDNFMIAARYQRTSKHYLTGWTEISLPITKHTTGYVQLSGQSLKSELVIIDSLRYIPDNSTMLSSDGRTNTLVQPSASTIETNESDSVYFEFEEIDGSGESEEEDEEGSGGSFEVTDDPDESETSTDDPVPGEDTEDPDAPGFWNAFTITLVSVGSFFVIGTISVGSYYLGKNRSTNEIPPLDIEALEPENVLTVPRVRSIFSDTYSERFSRFS